MPYFHNENINLLLIHIPKTGGTSLESYCSKKFDIPLNRTSLAYCKDIRISNVTLQHYPFSLISSNAQTLGVTINDNLTILSCVRNPYTRIVSDLLYLKLIMDHSDKRSVEFSIKSYFHKYNLNHTAYDNHVKPQHLFLVDKDTINSTIKIMKQESLTNDMHALGYTDFNTFKNVHDRRINYYDYLTLSSVLLINTFYKKDFELFDYNMIKTEEELAALQTNTSIPLTNTLPSSHTRKMCVFKKWFT